MAIRLLITYPYRFGIRDELSICSSFMEREKELLGWLVTVYVLHFDEVLDLIASDQIDGYFTILPMPLLGI